MKLIASISCFLFLAIIGASSEAQIEKNSDVQSVAQNLQLPEADPVCSSDMVEIEGNFCPLVQETCVYNVDIHGNHLPGPGSTQISCGEFKPTVCLTKNLVHKHFCIDKYEYPNKVGEIPQDWMTWYDVKNSCEAEGKRMCTDSEWTMAAEGPNMHPLPYGDGFHRDSSACNFDRIVTGMKLDVFQSKTPSDETSQKLRSLLVPSGSMPGCVSDYGVHDMSGNVDEWTVNESGQPYQSALKGGHIWHVRNAARPSTTAHGPTFAWYETSGRCCANPRN